uniref:VASt domain-containing protein n=1 Tax=Macrostomum lignano TaxID=282301 RepID=A0A1I8HE59_9PLAT
MAAEPSQALPTVELHDQQQQLRQRQSEPQLLQVPQGDRASRHRKRHSEFNLAGLTGEELESVENESESVSCHLADGHEHLDHVMADADIPMSVEQLAQCLLTDGPWFRDFLQRRRTFGIEASDFEDENGINVGGAGRARRPGDRRDVRYWLRINYAIGPKQTLVEETQTYVWCKPGKLHVVDCEVHNRDIPYGTSFHTLNRMCLTCRGPGRSHLTITSRTVFTRAVFLAKSFIESNVREGSQTYFRLMVDTLLDPNAGKTPINDEGGASAAASRPPSGSSTPATAAAAGAAAAAASSAPSVSSSTPMSRSAAAQRQQDGTGRPRPSTNSTTVANAAATSAATAMAGRRVSRSRSGVRSSKDGGQRLLVLCLLLASVLMFCCLVSLHLRFQSLDSSLDRLSSSEFSRSACAPAGDASRTGAAFTREQLDIWRRALDETLGSLDGLLFELRRVATAEATAAAAASSSIPAGRPVCDRPPPPP